MMKKLFSIIVCLLIGAMTFAQEGVNFRDLTYEEALAVAKAEKKMLFVDCYTSWCGPCKMMINKVFPQKKAGNYFNSRFVCVKYDMGTDYGKELDKKWNVKAYPTFLMIRPDGTIQHVVVGGDELEAFIKLVDKGFKEKTSLAYLKNRYEQGNITKKELLEYGLALQVAYQHKEAEKVRKELMEKLSDKDKVKSECWPLITKYAVGSEEFDFILANLSKYQKNVGKEEVDAFLEEAYSKFFFEQVGQIVEPVDENVDGGIKFQEVTNKDIEKAKGSVKKAKEQLSSLNSACQPALMLTHRIVEHALNGEVSSLLDEIDANMNSWTQSDVRTISRVFDKLYKKATKVELKKMSELSLQLSSKCKSLFVESWKVAAEKYKSLAQVGVYFEDLTLEEALEKARKMQKKVFVDCYTAWCGPCKRMLKDVFPQENVGDFLNSRFVCVKYDMDKNPEIEKQYGVIAYPTFLILNADGSAYHKMLGGYEAEEFMKRLQDEIRPQNTLSYLERRYNNGHREKTFLARYLRTLISIYSWEKANVVMGELWEMLSDEEKTSAPYWFMFESTRMVPSDSKYMEFLKENRDQFRKNVGVEVVNARFTDQYSRMLSSVMGRLIDENSAKTLKQIEKDLKKLELGNEQGLWSNLRIAQAMLTKNQNKILTVCEKEVEQCAVEKIPYSNLLYRYGRVATPAQKKRWIKLGEKMMEKTQEPSRKAALEKALKQFSAQK